MRAIICLDDGRPAAGPTATAACYTVAASRVGEAMRSAADGLYRGPVGCFPGQGQEQSCLGCFGSCCQSQFSHYLAMPMSTSSIAIQGHT